MNSGFSLSERGARRIRFGAQLLPQSRLRQQLMKEISELELRMNTLERSQNQKHPTMLGNYRNMILERLEILRDLLTN